MRKVEKAEPAVCAINGGNMKESNYEITKKKTAQQFLQYDQKTMIEKYHLDHDEDYLYLTFVSQLYRIDRTSGLVVRCASDSLPEKEAGYDEAMSIYDILCYAKENCSLSGKYCLTNSLKGIVKTSVGHPGDGSFQKEKMYFDKETGKLDEACRKLGGVPAGKGDVAYRIQVFPFLPVIFQFWNSDEDFDAEIQFLWDENTLQYMHFETLWYVMSHIVRRLMEEADADIFLVCDR